MDAEIRRIAAGQMGLVSREQALTACLSPGQIARHVRTGRWQRVQPNVYRVAGAPVTWEQRILAAVLSAGPSAVASHLSAAALWAFRQVTPDWAEITVDAGRPRLTGILVHRVDKFPDADRCEVRGIPV